MLMHQVAISQSAKVKFKLPLVSTVPKTGTIKNGFQGCDEIMQNSRRTC